MLLDRFFKREVPIPVEDDFIPKLCDVDDRCLESIDWDNVPEPVFSKPYDPNKKNILILDDISATDRMYTIDFKNIRTEFNKNVESEYNIIKCFGSMCGFIAEKFINNSGIKIDVGILDISIGNIIKLKRGSVKEIDGIDIAMLLMNNNCDVKVIFMTGHAVTMKNKDCIHYFEKFNTATGGNIEDCYYNKQDTNRSEKLYRFLYGYKD